MKQILAAVLLALTGCATASEFQGYDYKKEARRDTGCKGLPGALRFACLDKSIGIWQERENADGEEKIVNVNQEGDFLKQEVVICWSDFCRAEFRKTYKPTLMGRVERNLWIIAFGAAVGFAGGIAVMSGGALAPLLAPWAAALLKGAWFL